MRNVSIGLILVAAIALVVLPACRIAASIISPVDGVVEKALLGKDWRRVVDNCRASKDVSNSPVLRMLMGHSLLALNRNNESLKFFLSMSSMEEYETWHAWAGEFAARYPESPVSQYLLGDALARLLKWREALNAFDKSLEIDPRFILAMNARGVVLCALDRWEEAKDQLEEARTADSGFVDGHASLGTCHLMSCGYDAAEKAYESAIKAGSDVALIMNGLGCSLFMAGPRRWEEAGELYEKAHRTLPLRIIAANSWTLDQATAEALSKAELSFRPADFTDWESLKKIIANESSVLHGYFHLTKLPGRPNKKVLDVFNRILEDVSFYERHKAALDECMPHGTAHGDTTDLERLVTATGIIRSMHEDSLDHVEKGLIRGLNRRLLEECHEGMIARADSKGSGFSSLLSTAFMRGDFERHYQSHTIMEFKHFTGNDFSMGNMHKWENQYTKFDADLGGVSTEELMATYFRQDKWPVMNMFGLAYRIGYLER